jgi:hypothetical protein
MTLNRQVLAAGPAERGRIQLQFTQDRAGAPLEQRPVLQTALEIGAFCNDVSLEDEGPIRPRSLNDRPRWNTLCKIRSLPAKRERRTTTALHPSAPRM